MLTRRFSTALRASVPIRPATALPSSILSSFTPLSSRPSSLPRRVFSPSPSLFHRAHSPLSPQPTPTTSPSTAPPLTSLGRQGNEYLLSPAQIAEFHRNGYLALPGVLSDAELRELEQVYMRFMRREIPVPGKDLCDVGTTLHTTQRRLPSSPLLTSPPLAFCPPPLCL